VADQQHQLPRQYHEAVVHWQRHNFPDYPRLAEQWDTYFPKDEAFCLCARIQQQMPEQIEVGERAGQPKAIIPKELDPKAAEELLAIIRAQASTEFGSIQQHNGTLARAQHDEDRYWVMRVMAEELRHGYQMFHLLLSQDWSQASGGVDGKQMVEEILSMGTGSHVLDAFNLEYDSFIDNICFAAVIDRVGKYQLTMQKVCAYRPMADSMPPMLREEAFHLAAGVIPLRRWAKRAAEGDPFVTMQAIQKSFNKWFPRGLEMFGDERGGDKNLRFGFKDMKNREAQDLYLEEVRRMLRDINLRYLRARASQGTPEQAEQMLQELEQSHGKIDGIAYEDLLRLPDAHFFRRKGESAWSMIGVNGERFDDVDVYLRYLGTQLADGYMASRDLMLYADTLRKVVSGELTADEAGKKMPRLKRVGGHCPCSKSVRWVVEEPAT